MKLEKTPCVREGQTLSLDKTKNLQMFLPYFYDSKIVFANNTQQLMVVVWQSRGSV